MSKKKGLGRDINTSVEIMEEVLANLRKFHEMPIKRGLKSNNSLDEDVSKSVDTAMNKAFELKTLVGNLIEQVSGVKPKASSRFASQRVISNFLKF